MPEAPPPKGASGATPGYLLTTSVGAVASFGNVPYKGSLKGVPSSPVVGLAMTPDEEGYWLVTSQGAVYSFGNAVAYGSIVTQDIPDQTIVGMAGTPDGRGYWLVAAGGGVFTYGDAGFYGSLGTTPLKAGIVGMAVTPGGKGYWLVGSTGQVYAFGDARAYGAPSPAPASPVTGIAASADGEGYLLVTAGGQVYAFGDATFLGSAPSAKGYARVVGIASAPTGHGYWLLSANGSVFNFGTPWRGSGHGNMAQGQTAAAMTAAPGTGDQVVSKGAFGNTSPAYRPVPTTSTTTSTTTTSTTTTSTTTTSTTTTTVPPEKHKGGATKPKAKPKPKASTTTTTTPKPKPKPKASTTTTTTPKPKPKPKASTTTTTTTTTTAPARKVTTTTGPTVYPAGARGYDISWPQCGASLPPHAKVAIVGVNGGWAFTGNPCFEREASWAAGNLSVYINLNSPRGSNADEWRTGPAGRCSTQNLSCESYNFGYNTALYSVRQASQEGARSRTWWLDVETASPWSASQKANARVVAGALAALRSRKLNVAVYSTTYQWHLITGGYVPGTSAWYPTGIATPTPQNWCAGTSFAGGPVKLVQSAAGRFDGDYSC